LLAALLATLHFSSQPALAQFSQQGPKLVGTGATGASLQGNSVAVSADGNTAIVGGPHDSGATGAAWVFTRSGGAWTQQGSKLVGTGAVGAAKQGWSVALSADGNTAIIGGRCDNPRPSCTSGADAVGAAWVFTRSGGVWTQQGNKLVGTGAVRTAANQGSSVALSADGNTAVVSGGGDNGNTGAVWVFVRNGGIWTPQGNKLVGTGATEPAQQGQSVSLSSDGNTVIQGGHEDNDNVGAAWIFVRGNGVWSQQGGKLVGAGVLRPALQGFSVSLSGDGNTAIVGGFADNLETGAAWVFARSSGVWTQQGNKLVGTGTTGASQQGMSVSISADGNTAILGGSAAWVFTRSGGAWTQQGNKLVGSGAVGAAAVALSADGNTAIAGGRGDNGNTGAVWVYVATAPPPPPLACGASTQLGDFNADGRKDLVFRRDEGLLSMYFMNGAQVASAAIVGQVAVEWTLVGIGDFNGDGKADLLFRRIDGMLALYLMNGAQVQSAQLLGGIGTEWRVVGVGDFNGDGRADFMTRRVFDGMLAIYLMNGFQVLDAQLLGQVGTEWTLAQVADFNGDGRADFLMRRTDGMLALYLMNGFQVLSATIMGSVGAEWRLIAAGDFNGDGKADFLMRRDDGRLSVYLLNGTEVLAAQILGSIGTEWRFVGAGDLDGDARGDMVFRRTDGMVSAYLMNGFQVVSAQLLGGVGTEWESCYGQGLGGIAQVSQE
jgi:hypothetical protein